MAADKSARVRVWLVVLALIVAATSGGSAQSSIWPYYKIITIDHTKVAGPLSNFPVLVTLPADADLKTYAQPTGNDLLFTLPDGTKLSHELESYDSTTGQLVAWVKVPSLSATVDSVLYLKYGNAAAATQQDPPNVWTGYAGAWHLKESPTGAAPQFKDATANAHDGTSNGSQVAADRVIGKVGYGLHFDGSNDYVQTTSGELKTADSFTVALWFKANQTTFAHHLLWQGNAVENGWGSNGQTARSEMHISLGDLTGSARDNTLSFFLGQQSHAVDAGGLFIATPFTDTTGWNHVVVRVSTLGTLPSAQMFLNGVLVGSDTGATTAVARANWDANLRLGRPGSSERYFNGLLDEVEIVPTALSNAWITTAYNNQAAPQTFAAFTNGIGPPAGVVVSNVQATNITATSATITWATNIAADSRVDYGPTSGYGQNIVNASLVVPHSLLVSGLTAGTTYHYQVTSSTGSVPATSGDLAFTTLTVQPPLVISNVQISNLTSTAATITWTTNVAADSRVDYGLTTGYGQNVAAGTLVTPHSLTLTGLTAGTTYHYLATSSTGSAQTTSGDLTLITPPLPVISNVQVSNLTSTAATITWTTNVAADSRVDYGPTTGYGQNVAAITLVTPHSLTLTGLTAGTTYHYLATSSTGSAQTTSGDLTLITPPLPVVPNSWPYYKIITIDHTKVAGPLSNFPVLVTLPADPDLKTYAQPTGNDLLFTLPDGTKLSHELETYDSTTGQLVAWVRVPSLSATVDSVLYLKYGNAAAATQQDPPNVWTGYAGAWHLKESPTGAAPQFKDATGNAHDGTSNGSQVAGDRVTGKLGFGLHFDGSNDYVQTTSSDLKTADSFTVSLWVKANQTNYAHHLLWEGNGVENGWGSNGQTARSEMHISLGDLTSSSHDNTLSFFLGQQSHAVDAGGLFITTPFTDTVGWNHVVVRVATLGTAPSAQLFLNGALVGSDTGTTTAVARANWDTNLRLGRPGSSERYFNGVLDEVEIVPAALSNAWITTVYNNQAAPQTFYALTNGIAPPQTGVTILNLQVINITAVSATITWSTNVAADSRVDYGLTSSYGQNVTANPPVIPHNLTLLGLTAATPYHYQVTSSTGSAQAFSGDLTFTTLTAQPQLAISNVQVINLTSTAATITWTTNLAADSRVDYGLTNGYGQSIAAGTLVTLHSLTLTGLTAGTTYHFAITSRDANGNPAGSGDRTLTTNSTGGVVHHYLYVVPDNFVYVYDMDNNFNLVKTISVPTGAGTRGTVSHAGTASLYISYGANGGGTGYLLKYDLLTDTVVWTASYPLGIDSMDITPDGSRIYMPAGSLSPTNIWTVINTANGSVITTIAAGDGPHNTVMGPDGKSVYLAGRYSSSLNVADTTTNKVVKSIGPLISGGRPFTINGKQTLAFNTVTGFLGFQVSSIVTGQVLYTVPIQGFGGASPDVPESHGISLSPDERELYVIDRPNDMVHVFDVSNVPQSAPVQVADLHVDTLKGVESGCVNACDGEGWLLHSRDGRLVFVGDAGNVINTTTRQTVAIIQMLKNTRKYVEIDWQNGVPIFGGSRAGIGQVH